MEFDWKRVTYRKKKGVVNISVFDRLGPKSVSHKRTGFDGLLEISHSFYFTNFPPAFSENDLRVMFKAFGSVCDLFVSKKFSKMGKRFGFVRFDKVVNLLRLSKAMENLWVGNYRIIVKPARFDKLAVKQKKVQLTQPLGQQLQQKKSYANKVTGHSGGNAVVEKEVILLDISGECFLNVDPSNVLMEKIRNIETMSNIYMVCFNEGFRDMEFKYIGGFWFMISFKSSVMKENFHHSEKLDSVFVERRTWVHSFVPDSRLVWIDVEGLPLHLWKEACFASIANNYGKVCLFKPLLTGNLVCGRLCIETSNPNIILESRRVKAGSDSFDVRIREVEGWVPVVQVPLQYEVNEDVREPHPMGDELEEEDLGPPGFGNVGKHSNVVDEEVLGSFVKDTFGVKGLDNEKRNVVTENVVLKEPVLERPATPVAIFEDSVDEEVVHGLSHNSQGVIKNGISMVDELSRSIQVGRAMGLKMKGTEKDLRSMINGLGAWTGD